MSHIGLVSSRELPVSLLYQKTNHDEFECNQYQQMRGGARGQRTGYQMNGKVSKDSDGFEDLDSYFGGAKKQQSTQNFNVESPVKAPKTITRSQRSPKRDVVDASPIKVLSEKKAKETNIMNHASVRNKNSWEKPSRVKQFVLNNLSSDSDDSYESDDSAPLKQLIAKRAPAERKNDISWTPASAISPIDSVSVTDPKPVVTKRTMDMSKNFSMMSSSVAKENVEKQDFDYVSRSTIVTPKTYMRTKKTAPKSPKMNTPLASEPPRSILKSTPKYSSRRIAPNQDDLLGQNTPEMASRSSGSTRRTSFSVFADQDTSDYDDHAAVDNDEGDSLIESGGSDFDEDRESSPVKLAKKRKATIAKSSAPVASNAKPLQKKLRSKRDSSVSYSTYDSCEDDSDSSVPIKKKTKERKADDDSHKTPNHADNPKTCTISPFYDPTGKAITPGRTRPKRMRWLPLEHWKNHRLVVSKLDDGIGGLHVEASKFDPNSETTKEEIARVRRERVTAKAPSTEQKTKAKSRQSKKKVTSSWLPTDYMPECMESEQAVLNPETNDSEGYVLTRKSGSVRYGNVPVAIPHLFVNPVKPEQIVEAQPVLAGSAFKESRFSLVEIALPPLSIKSEARYPDGPVAAFVHEACDDSLVLSIDDNEYVLSRGDYFWIPQGSFASLKNYHPGEVASVIMFLQK